MSFLHGVVRPLADILLGGKSEDKTALATGALFVVGALSFAGVYFFNSSHIEDVKVITDSSSTEKKSKSPEPIVPSEKVKDEVEVLYLPQNIPPLPVIESKMISEPPAEPMRKPPLSRNEPNFGSRVSNQSEDSISSLNVSNNSPPLVSSTVSSSSTSVNSAPVVTQEPENKGRKSLLSKENSSLGNVTSSVGASSKGSRPGARTEVSVSMSDLPLSSPHVSPRVRSSAPPSNFPGNVDIPVSSSISSTTNKVSPNNITSQPEVNLRPIDSIVNKPKSAFSAPLSSDVPMKTVVASERVLSTGSYVDSSKADSPIYTTPNVNVNTQPPPSREEKASRKVDTTSSISSTPSLVALEALVNPVERVVDVPVSTTASNTSNNNSSQHSSNSSLHSTFMNESSPTFSTASSYEFVSPVNHGWSQSPSYDFSENTMSPRPSLAKSSFLVQPLEPLPSTSSSHNKVDEKPLSPALLSNQIKRQSLRNLHAISNSMTVETEEDEDEEDLEDGNLENEKDYQVTESWEVIDEHNHENDHLMQEEEEEPQPLDKKQSLSTTIEVLPLSRGPSICMEDDWKPYVTVNVEKYSTLPNGDIGYHLDCHSEDGRSWTVIRTYDELKQFHTSIEEDISGNKPILPLLTFLVDPGKYYSFHNKTLHRIDCSIAIFISFD